MGIEEKKANCWLKYELVMKNCEITIFVLEPQKNSKQDNISDTHTYSLAPFLSFAICLFLSLNI